MIDITEEAEEIIESLGSSQEDFIQKMAKKRKPVKKGKKKADVFF